MRGLVDLAKPLEGLTRNIGMHAGGVLIAPGKLTDFCPLYCQPGQENSAVSQFDKDDVEAAGLVKFDFLGLRNLTILDWAVRYVRQFNADKRDFDVMALELDDAAAYKILCDANTTAVFQLESRGMKELLRSCGPTPSKISSPCWPCTVRGRWNRAWWTISSTASTAAPRWTTSTPTWRAPSRAPMGSLSTRNR